jgi:hypothetical protein
VIKKPTERINQRIGKAIAHEEAAKKERAEARREFELNIAYYYEAKQRLRNPGYRTDVDGGMDRTPEENQKNFGASDWATFNSNCRAYSLQHADRMLKAFAKANDLLTDDGDNIDDDEADVDESVVPQSRRTADQTARKRYEHIASAAMSIANRNPDGEVEKQILAAAEHVPAPLMAVPPDIFTEVLGFFTALSSAKSSTEVDELKADAKRLLGKLLLHQPKPNPVVILAEATEEEKRTRGKRLAAKNGHALGSKSYGPPSTGTSEHVQRSDSKSSDSPAKAGAGSEPAPVEVEAAAETDEPEPEAEFEHAKVDAVTSTSEYVQRYELSPAMAKRPFSYAEGHCWQYDVRLNNREQDLVDAGLTEEEAATISIGDLAFRQVDKAETDVCRRIVLFIRRHEWLATMCLHPTHRIVAEYKGQLAGVVIFSMPTAFSTLFGDETKHLERLISRGACVSWSPANTASAMLAFAINWMVQNTPYRLFTAYADTEAQEIGQIYQACNFLYLGQCSGAQKMYFDPIKPDRGFFSDRAFRSRAAWKRYAKALGIDWKAEWQSGETIFWYRIPEEISSKLRGHSKAEQARCEYRILPRKHKYAMIRGQNRGETKQLMQKFAQLNPKLIGLAYPKRVNSIREETDIVTHPPAESNVAVGEKLSECRNGSIGGVVPRKPPESVSCPPLCAGLQGLAR